MQRKLDLIPLRSRAWKMAPSMYPLLSLGLALVLAGCLDAGAPRVTPGIGPTQNVFPGAEDDPSALGAADGSYGHTDTSEGLPGDPATMAGSSATCGNGNCEDGESTLDCVEDCGSICGDGACNGVEVVTNCPDDCGVEDDAVVVSADFPDLLGAGDLATATVVMRNTGTATWTRAKSYKLGAVGDEDPFKIGDVRVWLDESDSVPPGAEHTFEIQMNGGQQLGSFTTDWQMVHEGVTWFGETTAAEITVDQLYPLPLPNMYGTVQAMANAYPDLLANSCQDEGGTWEFMDLLVDELRLTDERWGYNWKRGKVGDPSQDVVDYHYGPGEHEGSEEVYIIDVIVGHCGPNPSPGWGDQTQATLDQGEIGKWTGRGRF